MRATIRLQPRHPDRAHGDLARAAAGLQHLAAAEVDRDVLAAARAPEQQIPALGLFSGTLRPVSY